MLKSRKNLLMLMLALGGLWTLASCDQKPMLTEGYYKNFTSRSALEQKFSQRGSHGVAHTEIQSDRPVIGKISVWYPQELQDDKARYPVVMVVNASNTKASSYAPFFDRLASWGFIAVGTEDPQAGSGETATLALDVILNAPRDSALHERVDTRNIGIIGYSQGGAGAIGAVTKYKNSGVFKTIFTGSAAYALLSKNMGWEYDAAKVKIPYFMTAGTGSSDDRGVKDTAKEFGGVAPLSSLKANYDSMPDNIFKVRARVVNAEHWDMIIRTDGYMTAWMRYQLQGDREAESVFVGDNAELLKNKNWQDVEKNR